MIQAWRDLDRAVGNLERSIIRSVLEDWRILVIVAAIDLPVCLVAFGWFEGNGYRLSGLAGLISGPLTFLLLELLKPRR